MIIVLFRILFSLLLASSLLFFILFSFKCLEVLLNVALRDSLFDYNVF